MGRESGIRRAAPAATGVDPRCHEGEGRGTGFRAEVAGPGSTIREGRQ